MKKEVWKDVFGYAGYYQVSDWGNIKSLPRPMPAGKGDKERQLKGGLLKPAYVNGYKRVALSKNDTRYNRFVHRLVAEAFLQHTPERNVVNHKNGVKEDNMVENLEWCTTYENNHDPLTVIKKRNTLAPYKKGVIAINVKTGEEFPFTSLNDAAKFLGEKSAGSVSGFFRGDRSHVKGYIFKRQGDADMNGVEFYKSVILDVTKLLKALIIKLSVKLKRRVNHLEWAKEKGLFKSKFKK